MLLLILKSSTCLAVFMVFYKLCLEKTSVHTFKRFYLLSVILISITIPFITFTEYIESPLVSQINTTEFNNIKVVNNTEINTFQVYLQTILWSIYGLGVLLFSFRFIKNLYEILQKIKTNPKFRNSNYINVLLHDLITPHTFFNYIFLNKTEFEKNQIPNEVLLHEQTHAKQKHALDILFIEVLQILFWFNPLLHFIKKDIKLNHEFLADQVVLKTGSNTKNYQQLLLAFSSNAVDNPLANAINYSLIKKRFTVMKTKTSKKSIWFRSLLLLPMLVITLFSFSNKKEIVINNSLFKNEETPQILLPQEQEQDNLLIEEKLNILSDIDKELGTINNLKINYSNSQQKATQKEVSEYNKLSKYCANKIKGLGIIKLKDVERLNFLYSKMSTLQKKDSEIYPDFSKLIPPPIHAQQKATPEQVAEYNKLAKKYNTQPENKRKIKLKDIKRLEYLYSLMSKTQKANAEPFPNCPPLPPPPVPKEPNAKEIIEVNPPNAPKTIKAREMVDAPSPPDAPEPPSPLDYVINMAKKGATFYYNNKKISSDRAIDLIKKNKDLNISTKTNNGVSIVKIQIEPISH